MALAAASRCGNTYAVMEPADCIQRPGAHYRRSALRAPWLALLLAAGLAGCGGEASRLFAAEGAHVTIVDRQEGGAEALAAKGYPLKAVFTREQLIGKAQQT